MTTVHVDSNLIDRLLGNRQATDTFSFLRTAKLILDSQKTYSQRRKNRSCKTCDRTESIKMSTYQSVKKAIAGLNDRQQEVFKNLLLQMGYSSIDQIKVTYRAGLKAKDIEF